MADMGGTLRRASLALERSDPQGALSTLWPIVDRSHTLDEEFRAAAGLMARAYSMAGLARAAATVHLYLGQAQEAWALSPDAPTDRARCEILAGRPASAAQRFEEAGWLGHAAMQLEDAGNDRGARVLWERLVERPELRSDPYTAGLVSFNLGRACHRLGDATAARRALVRSVHQLEAAADGFEAQGLRERAFDCFQVIMTLGKEGAFENLAEGYLNCIRILREDNLRYYVLQYYEDFQKLALERGELHAAATLFREAADYARRQSLPQEGHYRLSAARAHVAAAERTVREGGPVELAENAYTAAIDAFNQLGAYSSVSQVYGALASLPLSDKRRARYVRLQTRLSQVPDDNAQSTALPDYLRMDTAYPEIWRLDVVEWEQAGDAAETMGEVLQDPKWPEYTRRLALLCRLHQVGRPPGPMDKTALAQLAERLGRVGIYASLAPLERLSTHDRPHVRAACQRAARELFFKRTFVMVIRGLADSDASVRKEALAAVRKLHFTHAFDPLARIYRSSADAETRRAALESIGRIASAEAVELLIEVLRNGDDTERKLATKLLARSDYGEAQELLRRAGAGETGLFRDAIDRALKGRATSAFL